MSKFAEYLSVILLDLTGIILIALQIKPYGWIIFASGLLLLLFLTGHFKKDLQLLYLSFIFIGISPINTDVNYRHLFSMSALLILALVIPYIPSWIVYKNKLKDFHFHVGIKWNLQKILYLVFVAVTAYLLVPFFLMNTGSYRNWTVTPSAENFILLFAGVIVLGIWDELFFVYTVSGTLRKYFPFIFANAAQGILYTSFLYTLGFRGWGFLAVFCFVLLQGYAYKKTGSIFYVILIHITVDTILFLSLLHAHFPNLIPIFMTG